VIAASIGVNVGVSRGVNAGVLRGVNVGSCAAGSWPLAFDAVADVALNVSASLRGSRVERDPLSGTEYTMKYTVYGDARADGLLEGCVALLRDPLAGADGIGKQGL